MWVALGMPALLIALGASPLGPNLFFVVIGIPALLLVWAFFGIWALIQAFRFAKRREWSSAAVNAVLPLVVLAAGMQIVSFIQSCGYYGDVAHFIFVRSGYVEKIRTSPANGEPRLVVFNRGGMIWASSGYVYDESDEIMREDSLRSPGWKTRADGTELTCGFYARPFPGHLSFTQHWYIASFLY